MAKKQTVNKDGAGGALELLRTTDLQHLSSDVRHELLQAAKTKKTLADQQQVVQEGISTLFQGRKLPAAIGEMRQRVVAWIKNMELDEPETWLQEFLEIDIAGAIRKGMEFHLTKGYIEDARDVASKFSSVDFTKELEAARAKLVSSFTFWLEKGNISEVRRTKEAFGSKIDFGAEIAAAFEERLTRGKFEGARKILDRLGEGVDLSTAVRNGFLAHLSDGKLEVAEEIKEKFGTRIDLMPQVRQAILHHLSAGSLGFAAKIQQKLAKDLNLETEVRSGFAARLAKGDTEQAIGIMDAFAKDTDLSQEKTAHIARTRDAFFEEIAVLQEKVKQDEDEDYDSERKREKFDLTHAKSIRERLTDGADLTEQVRRAFEAQLENGDVKRAITVQEAFGKEIDLSAEMKKGVAKCLARGDVDGVIAILRNKFAERVDIRAELKEQEDKVKAAFESELCTDPDPDTDFRQSSSDEEYLDLSNAKYIWGFCKGIIELIPEVQQGVEYHLIGGRLSIAKEIKDAFGKGIDFTAQIQNGFGACLQSGEMQRAMDVVDEWGVGVDFTAQSSLHAGAVVKGFAQELAHGELDEAMRIKNKLGQGIVFGEAVKQHAPQIQEAFVSAFARDFDAAAVIRDTFGADIDFTSKVDEGVRQRLSIKQLQMVRALTQQLHGHNFAVTDPQLVAVLDNRDVQRLFTTQELQAAMTETPEDITRRPKEVMLAQREKMFEQDKYLQVADKEWYGKLSEQFGKTTVLQFMGGQERSYLHVAGPNILRLYENSGLSTDAFSSQVLLQVAADTGSYDNGMNSYTYFNTVMQGIDMDVPKVLEEAKAIHNPKLQELVALFERDGICTTWKKHMQKYYELCRLLQRKDVLKRLDGLITQGKHKQYEFFSELAFHPNISMQQVFLFLEDPARFLDVEDGHSAGAHERKKPSNFVKFEHLDLTAEDLRDALIEGDLDALQYYPPFRVDYRFLDEEMTAERLVAAMLDAMGERSKQRQGRARNLKETFRALQTLLKAHNLTIQQVKDNPASMSAECRQELERIVYDPVNGMKDERKGEEYRVAVHAKSSPEGLVAGNDTACCMPFGSGKNNVYMYNLGCATLTVQRKVGGGYRTIAQSVLTPDVNIEQSVADIVNQAMRSEQSLHHLIKKDLSTAQEIYPTADNIEIAPNYKGGEYANLLRALYGDFLRRYLSKVERPRLRTDKLIVGQGYTDMPGLQEEENTYIPAVPPGYSDNLGKKCFVIDLQEQSSLLRRTVVQEGEISQAAATETPSGLPPCIRPLIALDAIQVSYMEGKIYSDNESLIQYIHRIGNELIAKDINNRRKKRPNLSLVVEDEEGTGNGYIIAYEGVLAKRARQSERAIYISDLAAKGKMPAGRLVSAFMGQIEEQYLKNGELIPIVAEARESTSYKLIQNKAKRLGAQYGVRYEVEEIGEYEQGQDTMKVVILRPHRIEKE